MRLAYVWSVWGAALFAATCGVPMAESAALGAAPAEKDPKAVEFFEKKIRPVLVEKCYSCHSVEAQKANKLKGNLLLDTKMGMLKGGDSGAIVVPGKVKESLLIDALKHDGVKMPPQGKLPEPVIADFVFWVEQGAFDPREEVAVEKPAPTIDWEKARQHWSFQPVKMPAIPPVKHGNWPRNEIDRFILSRLEAAQLSPAQPADKRTLLRRVTFDLVGLPPTPDEMAAFLQDESSEAYAKVVDRLLASPHYGERWGRHWLDVARYAEDQAHTFGVKPNTLAYRYRDWVITALNQDLPFEQFVKYQIAADFLTDANDPAQVQHRAALGFFGLGAQYYKNTDAAKAIADEWDDRVDTLARGFLGLTLQCARCHDHKYDPIPQQDYYSIAGVFSSSKLTDVSVASKAETDKYQAWKKQTGDLEKELGDYLKGEKTRLAEAQAGNVAEHLLTVWKYKRLKFGNGKLTPAEFAKAEKLDPALFERWLKYVEPNNKLTKNTPVFLAWQKLPLPMRDDPAEPSPAVVQVAIAYQHYVQTSMALRDNKPLPSLSDVTASVQSRLRPQGKDDLDSLVDAPAKERPAGSTGAAPETVGGTAGSKGTQDEAKKEPLDPKAERPKFDPMHKDMLASLFAENAVYWPTDNKPIIDALPAERKAWYTTRQTQLDELKKAPVEAPPMVHAVVDGTPADLKIYLRGNPAKQGDLAPRRFLRVLAGENPTHFQEGSGRKELALAVGSPDNPLTTRVMVNRLWQHHFGRGLVGTASNFGLLGERPTHPELLDYLATRLIRAGGSLKTVHREIVLSATYQLSSVPMPEHLAQDPDNRLWGRANRRRLDVESFRDALLTVSGRLDRTLGGPTTDLGNPDNKRRTVYAKISRHELDGFLRLFDFPDANITAETRTETTVPQQQLFVLNSPFFVNQAKALATRAKDLGSNDADRIRQLYELVYSRPATEVEVSLGTAFLSGSDPAEETPKNQLSRWERYAQVLLGSNEFVYVD